MPSGELATSSIAITLFIVALLWQGRMTVELSLVLSLAALALGLGMVVMMARNQLPHTRVDELTQRIAILDGRNLALQEALAVVQAELGDTRCQLTTEREKRLKLEQELALIQQELLTYKYSLRPGTPRL